MISAAAIELVTVLGKGFVSVMKTKPNFNQKKVAEYEDKLEQFISETSSDYGDSRVIGELHDFLRSHGRPENFITTTQV